MTFPTFSSKIEHGSIENGSAVSDLPPEGPKKERWADLAHLAHFGNLAHFSGFTTQDSELRTQDSELWTQDSGLRTQNTDLRTEERKVFYAERFLRNV